jgi:uncharacterized membrane protein YgaE (UPF0421/DUF939 family)
LVASDPGHSRLLQALAVGLSVSVTIAVEYVFARLAHPLWLGVPAGQPLPAPQAPKLVVQHRGVTDLAMVLGGIVALLSTFVNDPTRRDRAVTIVGTPIPLLAMAALGIELAPHHTLGLVVLSLVVGVGTYGRKFVPRFGPRAFQYGSLLFVGYLFGFLTGRTLRIDQLYWLAAIAWLAVAVDLLLRLAIYEPITHGLLPRSARSFAARARTTLGSAIELLDARTDAERGRRARRLAGQLAQLNVAALMIDAQLADPEAQLRPGVAAAVHDQLFELELAVHEIGRLTQRLAATNPPADVRERVRESLVDVRSGRAGKAARAIAGSECDSNLVAALATEIVQAGAALDAWIHLGSEPVRLWAAASHRSYESPVVLRPDGRLRGSAPVSQATAIAAGEHGLLGRLRIGWAGQMAIRLAVAVGAACAAGSALSERRFYWAVIAVFIAFTGAHTAGEQLFRALERTVGTFVGVLVGSLLATAIGPSAWSLAVIIPALMFGVYFLQVSYWLMAAGITILVSQLYVQLGEYSSSLLVLRLKETALGAVIAMLVAVLVFPIGTRRAATRAAAAYLDALESLLAHVSGALREPPGAKRLTADSRALDDTMQQLLATAQPLTRPPTRPETKHRLALIARSAEFARRLASEADRADQLDERSAALLREALDTQRVSLATIRAAVCGRPVGAPLDPILDRLAGLDGQLEESAMRADARRPMLRSLGSLDKTLMALGESLGLAAGDVIPAGAGSAGPGGRDCA